MADIFLSYSRHDKERIGPLVKALEAQGWSVWWDRKIPPGKTFDEVIEAALAVAKCVVVVWSKDSVGSDWVKAEASEGAERKILVPVAIDNVRIPLAYRLKQSSQLADWDGVSPHPELELLFASARELIGASEVEPPSNIELLEKEAVPVDPQFETLIIRTVYNWRRLVSALLILVAVVGFGWAIVSWKLRIDEERGKDEVRRAVLVQEASKFATPTPGLTFEGEDHQLFNNWNTGILSSNPTQPTQFTIERSSYITNIYDYHYEWNGANPSGKGIKLRSSDGKEFGPWEVFAGSGHAEKQNVNWVCSPKITLPAGTYTIIDPDPASWSQNNMSKNQGMSLVRGYVSNTP